MSGKGAAELTAAGKSYTFSDLALACEAAAVAAAADLPDILPAVPVSEGFAAGVRQMHSAYRRKLRLEKILHTAAGIALALVLTFSAVITVNARARDGFLTWWKEIVPGSTAYRFESEDAGDDGLYSLDWLPEGLNAVQRTQSEGFGSIAYEGGGHMLVFEYFLGDGSGAYQVFGMSEGVPAEIGGRKGRLFTEDGRVNLIWADEEKGIVFTISSDLDVQTVLRAAGSVREGTAGSAGSGPEGE